MCIKVVGIVRKCGFFFSGAERDIMLAIADFANTEGFCYPSIPRLAHEAQRSTRQVRRVIDLMIALKLLSRKRGGGRSNNRYTLNVKVLGRISDTITSVEDEARRSGAARYVAAKEVAINLRREREAAIRAETEPETEDQETQKGDVRSPYILDAEITERGPDVTPEVTHHVTPAVTPDVTSGVTPDVTLTINKPLLETSVEPSAPPEQEALQSGSGGTLREDLLRVERTATAIGVPYREFLSKAGGPRGAAFLARKFERGDLSPDRLREFLEAGADGLAGRTEMGSAAIALTHQGGGLKICGYNPNVSILPIFDDRRRAVGR